MADVIFERYEPKKGDIPEGFVAYKVKKGGFTPFATNFKLLENLLRIGEKEQIVEFRGNSLFGTYYIVSKETKKIMCIVQQTPMLMGFLVPEKEPQMGFSLVDKVYLERGISYLVKDQKPFIKGEDL
jgi:hypothetical protein